MSDVIQRNPLLFGGLGLTVGMLIASALPKSDIEKNIMGDASADVRNAPTPWRRSSSTV